MKEEDIKFLKKIYPEISKRFKVFFDSLTSRVGEKMSKNEVSMLANVITMVSLYHTVELLSLGIQHNKFSPEESVKIAQILEIMQRLANGSVVIDEDEEDKPIVH